jgi:hypothetical protein
MGISVRCTSGFILPGINGNAGAATGMPVRCTSEFNLPGINGYSGALHLGFQFAGNQRECRCGIG